MVRPSFVDLAARPCSLGQHTLSLGAKPPEWLVLIIRQVQDHLILLNGTTGRTIGGPAVVGRDDDGHEGEVWPGRTNYVQLTAGGIETVSILEMHDDIVSIQMLDGQKVIGYG